MSIKLNWMKVKEMSVTAATKTKEGISLAVEKTTPVVNSLASSTAKKSVEIYNAAYTECIPAVIKTEAVIDRIKRTHICVLTEER